MIETITTPRTTLVNAAFRSAAHNWVRNDENFFAYRRILIVDPPRPQSVRLAFLVSNRGTRARRGRWRTTGLSGTIEAKTSYQLPKPCLHFKPKSIIKKEGSYDDSGCGQSRGPDCRRSR